MATSVARTTTSPGRRPTRPTSFARPRVWASGPRSRRAPRSLVLRRGRLARSHPVDGHLALHPPEAALAGERPAVAVPDRLAYVRGRDDAAGAGEGRDPARQVHRSAVPVAAAGQGLADGDAGSQAWQ